MHAQSAQTDTIGIAARAVVGLLRDGRTVEFVALGGSMWPIVRSGALVRVEPCEAARLRPGDLAAYESARGTLVVHRVIGRLGDKRILFQGDAFSRADSPVSDDAVLGSAVVLRQPALRVRAPRFAELPRLIRAGLMVVRRTLARR